MTITNELTLEVARVILLVIFVHAIVNVGFYLQWLLNSLQIVVPLVESFDLFVHVKCYCITSLTDKLIDDRGDLGAECCGLDRVIAEVNYTLIYKFL